MISKFIGLFALWPTAVFVVAALFFMRSLPGVQGATRNGPTRKTKTGRRCTVPQQQETWGNRFTFNGRQQCVCSRAKENEKNTVTRVRIMMRAVRSKTTQSKQNRSEAERSRVGQRKARKEIVVAHHVPLCSRSVCLEFDGSLLLARCVLVSS